MTTAHCPSCDAAVAEGAPWCTLCFTSLRPAPEPAPPAPPAPQPVTAPATMPVDELAMAAVPAAPVVAAGPAPLPPHPILDAPVFRPDDVRLAEPSWPCGTCGETVPMDATACPACGAGFMAAAKSSVSLVLPGVGDVTKLSNGGRFALMAGGALVCTVVLYVVFLILGHLF